MRRLALVTVLVLASVCCTLFAACSDEGCSGVGCGPTVLLEVDRETWEPGAWEVGLAYGGIDGRCTWTVPAPAPGTDPDRCPGDGRPSFWIFDQTPDVIGVSLWQDGAQVGSRDVRPDYAEHGDECLTCTSADEVVVFE